MSRLRLARPPRWGVVLMSALVLVNIAVFGYLQLRTSSAQAAVEASAAAAPSTTPAPVSAAADPSTATVLAMTTPPATPPVLAVYGDGYSAGSPLGGQAAAGWPALVAQGLGMELRLSAVAQAGYVSTGVTGQTFGDLVTASPVPDADVTVVFGSRNDLGESPVEVGAASAETLAAVRAAAPETTLVVIGPMWTGGGAPQSLFAVRDAVEASAEAAGLTFVDPLEEGWFDEVGPTIASGGISATDAGHRELAELITVRVQAALPTPAG